MKLQECVRAANGQLKPAAIKAWGSVLPVNTHLQHFL